jgi:vibriolysin
LPDSFSAINDAHHNIGIAVDMYRDWYNIHLTAELQLQPVTIRVHYPSLDGNAGWCSGDINQILFGDGNETNRYPMVSLDVAAHELAHGFTEKLCLWKSDRRHAGGLFESFADMAGMWL